jgi:hypothetical protein
VCLVLPITARRLCGWWPFGTRGVCFADIGLEEKNMKKDRCFGGISIGVVSVVVLCLVASVLKIVDNIPILFNILKDFNDLLTPLATIFSVIFGICKIKTGITDSAIKKTIDHIGKSGPFYIGRGNDDNRYYYIGQNNNIDFNDIKGYKTEIGTDWDFTPQWRPSIENLLNEKKIKNVKAEALPDHSGNGERYCRGIYFVFSTTEKLEEKENNPSNAG